jgi:hypothetical protein
MDPIRIHDGVLADPQVYRARALSNRFQTVQDQSVQFRGIAPCADPTIPMWLKEHYPKLHPLVSFFRQSPEGQLEPHTVHEDRSMGDITALYYVNPQPPTGDGTNFMRHRVTGVTVSTKPYGSQAWLEDAKGWGDPDLWECWKHVPARFNRLVAFPAALYHSRAILENYGSIESGTARLLQVVFCEGTL